MRAYAAALGGLRRLALKSVLADPANRRAVRSLRADDVPITAFSQVLSDAYAGRGWLDILTILDGQVTNAVHRALAAMLGAHRCLAVITTNFDTLIERACRDAGVQLRVVLPLPGRGMLEPDASDADMAALALYKIHGTASTPESMVDLLLDKRRGLGPGIRSLIGAACRASFPKRHITVKCQSAGSPPRCAAMVARPRNRSPDCG